MHRYLPVALLAIPILPVTATAQLELPDRSPAAQTMQMVGLTEIEVNYSSPARRGRVIWGELVPFGQHWRAGANANTLVRFSKPVKIDGTTVEAGRYSFHVIPREGTWTLIINRKTDGGSSSSYEMAKDVVRYKAVAEEAAPRERLLYLFENTTTDSTELVLEWAGRKARLPIKVGTAAEVDANIEQAMKRLWRPPAVAARHLLDEGRDFERAVGLVDRSLEIEKTWFGLWVKAQLFSKLGRRGEAIDLTRSALEMGDGSGAFAFYSGQMKKALKEWGSKDLK